MKRRILPFILVNILTLTIWPAAALAADNMAPVITAPASIGVTEDVTTALPGISFSDADAGTAPVTVTMAVPSGTLSAVSGAGVAVSGSGTGTLTLTGPVADINACFAANAVTFTTVLNDTASVTLTATIDDGGNTGDGGALTDSATVTLVVSAKNDAPVNSLPAAQTVVRNGILTFSAANGNAVSVSDVDADSGLIRFTLTATNGSLSLSDIYGLSFLVGSGTGDTTMTFEGWISDINAACNGMTYTPTAGYTGSAQIQITTNDYGSSGSGGAMVDADTLEIGVLPVYSSNDFTKLQTFLNKPSAVAGKTNGQQINAAYSPVNPLTWTGVVWSATEPYRAVSIGASGEWYSKSLSGALDLSDFSQLNTLIVTQNHLTSLDLSRASALPSVFCFSNSLTALTLEGNTALQNIYCPDNSLTSLDLSGAPALTGIQCGGNQLTTIDVDTNAVLESLSVYNNQIAALDVSHNTALRTLHCNQNLLTTLDVSANTALRELACGNNQLTALDISKNKLLENLSCSDNQLTALDVSVHTTMAYLNCSGNQLTSLDIRACTSLAGFFCSDNLFSSLDFSANHLLDEIDCRGNRLTSLDLRGTAVLDDLITSDNLLRRIYAIYDGDNITLTASGAGYVELTLYDTFKGEDPKAEAVPVSGAEWVNWTSAGAAVSTANPFLLATGTDHTLTANFSKYAVTFDSNGGSTVDGIAALPGTRISAPVSPTRTGYVFGGWYKEAACTHAWDFSADTLSGDITLYAKWTFNGIPENYTMVSGGRVTWSPSPSGGTWHWDAQFFSATFNSPATFTALKAGTSVITYTAGGVTQRITVTVDAVLTMSSSDTDGKIYTNGRITLTPSIANGTWSFDASYLSRSGNTFTALKTGTSRVTYTAGSQSAYYDVTVLAAVLPETGQDFAWVTLFGLLAAAALVIALRVKTATANKQK